MTLKKKFAYVAYHRRNDLKLTQEYVAEKAELSVRSVQYIEKAKWTPARETMLKLMIVLQISPNEFAEEVGVDVPVSAIQESISIR
ncbi:MAG: helix-turn-helix transcriptional regulator [Clostridia bacterium]|nr:helix-turn-helix transcriptional regulator [Clostridia bacterium]